MIKQKIPIPLKLDFTQKKQGFSVLLIGIIIALVLGVLAQVFTWGTTWIWWVLAIGVIVGILNIFHEEGVLFILTLLTLTLMLNLLGGIALFPIWAVTLFQAVVYLLAPATVIVGLKVLYALAVK
ncbi:hypothetical protein AUJ69_02410 [Candidatus Woesearchaeota archaeon CG1_02_47_18]|nr:MAG: hypothetical protein AUJ69_02410 [Candidatus Woesearchaeota archaeon CG1_02_47_18]